VCCEVDGTVATKRPATPPQPTTPQWPNSNTVKCQSQPEAGHDSRGITAAPDALSAFAIIEGRLSQLEEPVERLRETDRSPGVLAEIRLPARDISGVVRSDL
jgi:hypothetical protein